MNGVCIIHMGYSFVEKGEYEWCIYVYMRCSFVEKGEYEWSVCTSMCDISVYVYMIRILDGLLIYGIVDIENP